MSLTNNQTKSPSILRPITVGLAGIAALTASSWVSVPMFPVPVTMQTLVVLLLGVMCGARMGSGIVLAWFALSMTGAPVFAGGASGLTAFFGPTAGYLVSFPIAAYLAGTLPRANSMTGYALLGLGFLGLHALILAMGWAWLSALLGPEAAFVAGVTPFLIGAIMKSALGAAFLAGLNVTFASQSQDK